MVSAPKRAAGLLELSAPKGIFTTLEHHHQKRPHWKRAQGTFIIATSNTSSVLYWQLARAGTKSLEAKFLRARPAIIYTLRSTILYMTYKLKLLAEKAEVSDSNVLER